MASFVSKEYMKMKTKAYDSAFRPYGADLLNHGISQQYFDS